MKHMHRHTQAHAHRYTQTHSHILTTAKTRKSRKPDKKPKRPAAKVKPEENDSIVSIENNIKAMVPNTAEKDDIKPKASVIPSTAVKVPKLL